MVGWYGIIEAMNVNLHDWYQSSVRVIIKCEGHKHSSMFGICAWTEKICRPNTENIVESVTPLSRLRKQVRSKGDNRTHYFIYLFIYTEFPYIKHSYKINAYNKRQYSNIYIYTMSTGLKYYIILWDYRLNWSCYLYHGLISSSAISRLFFNVKEDKKIQMYYKL